MGQLCYARRTANQEGTPLRARLKKTAKRVASRIPGLGGVVRDRDALQEQLDQLRRAADDTRQFVPPGHFYSPIPSLSDVRRSEDRLFRATAQAAAGHRCARGVAACPSALVPAFRMTRISPGMAPSNNASRIHASAGITPTNAAAGSTRNAAPASSITVRALASSDARYALRGHSMLTPSAAFHILTIVRGVLPSLSGVASLLLVAVFAGAAPGGAAADAKPAVDPGVRLDGEE